MRSVVVDASVAVKWVVDEPASERARALLQGGISAPDLLFAECGNALWKVARRGHITIETLRGALLYFASVPIVVHPSRQLLARALDIARSLEHSAYDCLYVALAERIASPCITADHRFAQKVLRSEWRDRIELME